MEIDAINDGTEKKGDKIIQESTTQEPAKVTIEPKIESESTKEALDTVIGPIDMDIHATTVPTADILKIENGKSKMKIKCVKCKHEDTLTEEDIKLLSHIVRRYNQSPSPNDYTAVLSIIKGSCTDGNKHLFIFDESFDKAVEDTIKEYHDAISANVARKETLEKICILIHETTNQIKSLGSSLVDLEKKKEHITAEMGAGGILVANIKLKFMKLTGTEDTTMWS